MNLKTRLFIFYIYVKRMRARLSVEEKRIKGVNIKPNMVGGPKESIKQNLFLLGSYRINSPLRQQIFRFTTKLNLDGLMDSSLNYRVIDASDAQYTKDNKEILDNYRLNLDYQVLRLNQQKSILKILESSPESYFCMVYDDQPIIGLNQDFFEACLSLLKDFNGLVTLILIESALKYQINPESKKIYYDLESLEYKDKRWEPLRIVHYGNYSFAIIFNYHYGFFFNTIIASRQEYSKKLKWYMDHVKNDNSQYIELAGMKRQGPVYNYIAVPLQAVMFNIDCAGTEISIREQDNDPRILFDALSDGYQFEARPFKTE